MNNVIDEIATVASEWWARILIDPKFDNGEASFADILAKIAVQDISERQLIQFKGLLGQYIVDKISDLNNPDESIIMGCDYGPDTNLRHFANEGFIPESNFPWKTTMTIGKDFCDVKYGYTELPTYLYVTEDRLQRRIDDAVKTVEYYQQKDNSYFNEWSSFTKDEILKIANDTVEKCKRDLEDFKNGTRQATDIVVS